MRNLFGQIMRFGIVGLGGLVIDIAVFNLLRLTILSPDVLYEGPLIAKFVSTGLAICANWIGNRHWTFATATRRPAVREGIEFLIVSLAGMGIGLACLWVSHYVLGFTSLLADNIATNVVGLALGSLFRFVLYRWWVFNPARTKIPTDSASTTPDNALRTPERTVHPTGLTPPHRIQTIAPIKDRRNRNE